MNNVLLQINNLQVNFDVLRGNKNEIIHAVQDVSFTLNKGEILGIVGESGSGKSVTTSCISGLLPSNANPTGTIFYKDVDLLKLKQEGKKSFEKLREYRGTKIGMHIQEPGRSFDPLQNIFSVFYETFKNSYPKITKNEAQKKATELLKETLSLPVSLPIVASCRKDNEVSKHFLSNSMTNYNDTRRYHRFIDSKKKTEIIKR